MIRSLIGTLQAEDAIMGVFVCLAEPTRPMKQLAASAGMVNTVQGRFPKVQITTIAEIFNDDYPALPRPIIDEAFTRLTRPARRRRISPSAQLTLALPIAGGGRKRVEEIEDHPAGRLMAKIGRGKE
jgi:hypothetical protein